MVVNVYGDDLDTIDGKASEVLQRLNAVPGAVGVNMQAPPGTPQLVVRLRPAQLARYELAPLDVLESVQTAFEGTTVAQLYEANQVHDVVVVLDPASRRSVEDVGGLSVRGPHGPVALREIAYIRESAGRSQIQHDGGQRVQTITSGVRGRAIEDFVRDAETRIGRQVRMPPGAYVAFGGEAEARRRSQHDLLVNSALAGVAIVLLLFLALRTTRATLLVLLNLPLALVGGVAIVLATGADLSLGSMIGFVTLFGITLRNSIMLVSHYQHLVERESVAWGPEAALRGASERLVPILMTATVTALASCLLRSPAASPATRSRDPWRP